MTSIRIHRVYDREGIPQGQRILVDGIWPRGVKREDLDLVEWMREVAPSAGLRKWFGHDPARWEEFRKRYTAELHAHPKTLEPLIAAAKNGPVVLLYGARDEQHNQAVVLKEVLERAGDGDA